VDDVIYPVQNTSTQGPYRVTIGFELGMQMDSPADQADSRHIKVSARKWIYLANY
jgi:hypothetical protein